MFLRDKLRFSRAKDTIAAPVICGGLLADWVTVARNWIVKNGTIPGVIYWNFGKPNKPLSRLFQG